MINRRVSYLVVLAVVIGLIATLDIVMARPMDGMSVGWLLANLVLVACATAYLVWLLLRSFWQRRAFDTIDFVFWIVFLLLPICIWLLMALGCNVLDWYRS